jgi:iron(III) transport system substrate-binding protein
MKATYMTAVAAVIAMSIIAAACGGDDADTATEPAATESTTTESAAAADGVFAGPAADLDAGIAGAAAAAEAAGEEEVVVAIWNGEDEIYTQLAESFEAAYPDFEVTLKSMDFIQMGAIVQSELDAGQRTADVVTNAFLALKPMLDAGSIDDSVDWAALGVPAERVAEAGFVFQSDGLCTTVVYNPDVVSEDELPDTLEGFAAPEWQDKLATLPSNGVACMGFYALANGLDNTLALVEDLEGSGLLFSDNAEQLMTTGERPVLVFHYSIAAPFLEAAGAPVAEKLYPGTGVFRTRAALVEGTPSPNLARLFTMWLISDDAMTAYEDYYAGGIGFVGNPDSALVQRTQALGQDPSDDSFFVFETIDNFPDRAAAADAIRSQFITG